MYFYSVRLSQSELLYIASDISLRIGECVGIKGTLYRIENIIYYTDKIEQYETVTGRRLILSNVRPFTKDDRV
jgi:hypothetical protein